jgi:diguanylate cyclase (GGDEF)-like protein
MLLAFEISMSDGNGAIMNVPILERTGFAAAVIDALSSHICVIDRTGRIVAVNRAWTVFAAENSPTLDCCGVGTSYLEVCGRAAGAGSEEAEPFTAGVRSVLDGRSDLFQLEYPCHSPTENRWFLGRVTPLKIDSGGAVISHLNITDRKLVELKIEKLAATDPLTGLPNRRYLSKFGDQDLERLRRFNSPASIVMIDLDYFKTVNDTFGHCGGDAALRRISKVFKAELRRIDVIARFGGEEFVAILPGTDEFGALRVAERLCKAVRNALIDCDRGQFCVTASFGVAEMAVSDVTMDEGVARADAALYLAKRSGRNRAQSFSSL